MRTYEDTIHVLSTQNATALMNRYYNGSNSCSGRQVYDGADIIGMIYDKSIPVVRQAMIDDALKSIPELSRIFASLSVTVRKR